MLAEAGMPITTEDNSLADVESLGLAAGTKVGLLLRREERLHRTETTLVACWPRVIILDAPTLEGSSLPIQMTVVSEDGEHWLSTNVRVKSRNGTKIIGAIEAPWSRLNRRRDSRVPVDMPVKLAPKGTRQMVNGRLLDISFGGAAVEIRGDFEWTRLRLRVARGGFLTHLDCDVVGARTGKNRTTVLHLAFRNASQENYEFLRGMIGSDEEPVTGSATEVADGGDINARTA